LNSLAFFLAVSMEELVFALITFVRARVALAALKDSFAWLVAVLSHLIVLDRLATVDFFFVATAQLFFDSLLAV